MSTAAIVEEQVIGVPHRRWFRFSLRTLLLLLTIACLVAAWLVPQLRWIRERHRALDDLAAPNAVESPFGNSAPWSIRLLGEQGYDRIAWVQTGTRDESIATRLRELFPEARICPMDQAEFDAHWPQ